MISFCYFLDGNKMKEHLSEPWFSLILLGLKPIEGRKNKGRFKELKIGEQIEWYNDDIIYRSFVTTLVSKTVYSSFEEYLNSEGLNNCLPGINSIEEGVQIYRKWSTLEEEKEFGVVALSLSLIQSN